MEYIEYDFTKVDPFRNYQKEIDNLDFDKTADGKNGIKSVNRLSSEMCAKLRTVLHKIREAVMKIGGKVLNIGLRTLNFIFKTLELFPNTACGLLIVACIHGIVTSIPFFGPILNFVMVPISAIVIASSIVKDCLNSDVFKKMMNSLVAATTEI